MGDENLILGDPGYRTREGRTGLDLIDTRAEAARMEGLFYRNLFTLRFRTRDPLYLGMMFVLGVIPFVGLLFLVVFLGANADFTNLEGLCMFAYVGAICGALTVNFVLSILEIRGIIRPLSQPPKQPKRLKKRVVKRRKDYQ